MKLNKNEQNYLLTILFKSYILQSVICSGIILVCTVSLDMGLTWVLDRYVEHYYLIYRGLYVYMVGLILWVVCIISVLLPPDSPITAPSYPIFSAVIAVITSVIVALLGGLLPAIKAAKLEPALALR